MTASAKPMLSGGCQCGAVRYRLKAAPSHTSICWCRMCQKAMGSYLAPFSNVAESDLEWTRGTPGVFHSSDAAERHFCRDCGTPLTYHHIGSGRISVSTASLDTPSAAPPPTKQYFPEDRPAFAAGLATLPDVVTASWITDANRASYVSHQHPDHDTQSWSPRLTSRSGDL